MSEEITLDATDLRILDRLQLDASASNQDLAAAVHTSAGVLVGIIVWASHRSRSMSCTCFSGVVLAWSTSDETVTTSWMAMVPLLYDETIRFGVVVAVL